MRINLAIPEEHVKAPVLNGALEAVTRLNEDLIQAGDSPTSHELLEQGAIWQPEKPGDEHFDHGGIIQSRGHGDCDDWAPLHAATLRVTGEDPGAKAVVRKSGEKRWHATVIRSDGTEDDPSIMAGMHGTARAVGARGATLPAMFRRARANGVNGEVGSFIATPHLALRPVADRHGQLEAWQSRADLPWHWQPGNSPADLAMVTLHQSPVSDQAIVGAARGAFKLGVASGFADPEHLKRMSAICEACEGYPWEEIAESYGPEHATAAGEIVGSFFGKAFKKLKKLASPLIKGALSFVPGGGLAAQAFDMASKGLKASLSKGKHLPPQQRAALALEPARSAPGPVQRSQSPGAAAAQPGGFGFPGGFMPYPYPVPYPMPNWSAAGAPRAPDPRAAARARARRPVASVPGAAWPPRK
jgi:hypothetical protein